jgi:hypothetical protein
MNPKEGTEAEYLLRKVMASTSPEFAIAHPWLWEGDRWKELVFAFFSRISDVPESSIREMVGTMSNLDLLDIHKIADLSAGELSFSKSPVADRIRELMEETGFSPEQAQKGLTTLSELALGIVKHFDGKLQRFLRHYGELMLRDLSQLLPISTLNARDVKYASVYWLQNVLNMPISLVDQDFKDFCKQHDLKPDQLILAADELDVNLALVDDIVQLYMRRKSLTQNEKTEDPVRARKRT